MLFWMILVYELFCPIRNCFSRDNLAGFTLIGNLTDSVFQALEWRFSCRGRK